MVNKIDYEKLNNVQCYCQWATFKAIPGALGTDRGKAITQAQEFFAARQSLFDSLAEVSGPTYQNHLQEVKSLIETYDGELSGQQAEAFCALSEAVEQAISKGENS